LVLGRNTFTVENTGVEVARATCTGNAAAVAAAGSAGAYN
jgi:hypothetical protein